MTRQIRHLMASMSILVALTACAGTAPEPKAPASSPQATDFPKAASLVGDLPVWEPLPSGSDPALVNPQAAGGFVHFPDGTFHTDPHADMMLDRSNPNVLRARTPDRPYLYAGTGSPVHADNITFDRIAGRWLPVNQSQVSADGLSYAYLDRETDSTTAQLLHVVDVRSATDKIVYSAPASPLLAIMGLARGGVYLASCQPSEVAANCFGPLRRVDAMTGVVSTVSDRRGQWVISEEMAWVATCWPNLLPTQCLAGQSMREPAQLLGIDLTTGAEKPWHEASGFYLVGIDRDGLPLIAQGMISPNWTGAAGQVWGESVLEKIVEPEQTERLFSIPTTEPWAGFGSAQPDRVGIWLLASYVPPGFQNSVLYLYSNTFGWRELSHNFNAVPAGPFG